MVTVVRDLTKCVECMRLATRGVSEGLMTGLATAGLIDQTIDIPSGGMHLPSMDPDTVVVDGVTVRVPGATLKDLQLDTENLVVALTDEDISIK